MRTVSERFQVRVKARGHRKLEDLLGLNVAIKPYVLAFIYSLQRSKVGVVDQTREAEGEGSERMRTRTCAREDEEEVAGGGETFGEREAG